MASNKEQLFAYILAAVLLVVGVVSYAAFPPKTPEQPIRIMFQSIAGQVLFDMKTHTSDSGYGLSCRDCHHTLEEGQTNTESCLDCHEFESDDPELIKREDAFHRQCSKCHQEFEAGPLEKECEACHVL